MCIFSIETSCDDTCFTIYNFKDGVLFEKLYRQSYIHTRFKGVVPNIALSEHKQGIQLLYNQLILSKYIICFVVYTQGPGLSGSLCMGMSFAKSFAYFLNVTSVSVNHLEGHLLSIFLTFKYLSFPYITLLISGGHTYIIYVHCLYRYVILGMSLDDSVGESFDKVACFLGLDYPGGPLLESNLYVTYKYIFMSCY
jgi:N6-L-threonylcarbamoyladenine synthase